MSDEPATPDLVELTRRVFEAMNRRDMDAVVSRCLPDCVYDPSPTGQVGVFEGPAAIRGFVEDWSGAFEELRFDFDEVRDLGGEVVLAVVRQVARPAGSTRYVRAHEAYVCQWVGDKTARVTVYLDIDAARAAAQRLAEERG